MRNKTSVLAITLAASIAHAGASRPTPIGRASTPIPGRSRSRASSPRRWAIWRCRLLWFRARRGHALGLGLVVPRCRRHPQLPEHDRDWAKLPRLRAHGPYSWSAQHAPDRVILRRVFVRERGQRLRLRRSRLGRIGPLTLGGIAAGAGRADCFAPQTINRTGRNQRHCGPGHNDRARGAWFYCLIKRPRAPPRSW